MTDQQQLLDRALEFHGKGNLGEAEKLYRGVLERDPGQADALHYLGVIGLQTGRLEDAVTLIQQAVDARPDYVDAIVNLGNALHGLGRFDAAIERFEHALELGPETAPLLANLGAALEQLGRFPHAVERYKAALELQPDLAEARRSLADALSKAGRPSEALTQISKAVSSGPPSLAMQVSMGNILHAAGRSDDAVKCFNRILEANPEIAPVRGNLANVLRQTGRLDEALEHYEMVLRQAPDHVEGHYNLGLVYQDLGQKDKALKSFRAAVEIDRTCAKAWHGMSAVSSKAFSDDEVNALLAQQQADGTLPEQRMRLAFGLGKHFENSGNHAAAAEQYLIANPLKRAEFDYNIDNDMRAYDNLRARFDAAFFTRWQDAGVADNRPIFIVGMPRSGTTLAEQIIASHRRVFGAGELTLLVRAISDRFPIPDGVDFTDAVDNATAEDFQTVATQYLRHLPDTDAERITDKLPHNFLNVGMIRVLFPNAKIVHCRRDPRDTCFSIYKNLFGAHGHFYAYELEELGRYYTGYARLMQHWEETLPGVLHTVDYETLVDNQEQATRALLDYCGLEWDPACLDFHKLERPVATLSASQVRQPVYRGSIGAWKNYEEMLQPLIGILAQARNL